MEAYFYLERLYHELHCLYPAARGARLAVLETMVHLVNQLPEDERVVLIILLQFEQVHPPTSH
jgi:hypothetical protein